MVSMSSLLAPLDNTQKQAYYLQCAELVLTHYALGPRTPHFVQHNAGIVFRLEDAQGEPCFLLKIHESAGDGMVDMIMAALFNLAFQATLPQHRLSPINRRNMQQFVEKFCRPFVADEPFLFTGQPLTVTI